MKHILLFLTLLVFSLGNTQTLLWSDNFENTAADWDLTIQTGVNDLPNHNRWVISDAEGGVAPNGCGEKTNGNKTLHVACQGPICALSGVVGAVYYPGGTPGQPGNTNLRAALVNSTSTTGKTDLEIVFDWMGVGQANKDFAELSYSIDYGVNWIPIWTQTPGSVCPSGEARWIEETVTLPVGAENQADMRFSFNWQNDNDGVPINGSSFAVNDMRLYTNAGSNADFTTPSFTICENDCIDFTDASTGSNISSWNWEFNGANTAISTAQNPTNICYSIIGTHDVKLTITDDNGTDDVTYQIMVNDCSLSPPTAIFSADTLIVCKGDCISFTDLSIGDPTSWNWTFQNGNPLVSNQQNPGKVCYDSSGVFDVTLTVTNANGTNQIINSVTVLDLPEIKGYGDTIIDIAGAAVLFAEPIDFGVVFWDPSDNIDCPTCQEVIATPLFTTTYYPSLIGANGCIGRDTVLVVVNFKEIVEVPSGFSPNGDGVNDFIHVLGIGITSINFKIFNRYGQLVFATTDINEGWDGTMNGEELNQGVFVYTLEFDLIDGSSGEKSGNITLVK